MRLGGKAGSRSSTPVTSTGRDDWSSRRTTCSMRAWRREQRGRWSLHSRSLSLGLRRPDRCLGGLDNHGEVKTRDLWKTLAEARGQGRIRQRGTACFGLPALPVMR